MSRWIRKTTARLLPAKPIAAASGMSETVSSARNQANPTQTISWPIRFVGRRSQAKRPVPMKDQPTRSVRTASSSGAAGTSLVATITKSAIPDQDPNQGDRDQRPP